MNRRNALDKLKILLEKPSFTSEEAHNYGVSSATLAYYVKQHKLKRIGHGIYRGMNAPVTSDFRWEDLIEAVQRTKGGIICLISALAIYQLTDEIPRQHWIAIRHGTVHRADLSTKVVRMRNLQLGKTTVKIGSIAVPIFDRERTIVDAFRYLGSETALKALKISLEKKGSEKINLDKLRKYARILRVQIQHFIMAMTI